MWHCFHVYNQVIPQIIQTLRPWTGDDIYDALFEQRQTNCVKILNYQDHLLPKIDCAIWLHFETCPNEFKRMINLHKFKTEIVSTKGWHSEDVLANESWFKPASLGDSMLVFTLDKDERYLALKLLASLNFFISSGEGFFI